MSRPISPAVFALKAWTIMQKGDKFFIAPTAAFDEKTRWSKPYATLQRATTAVARKLADEWLQRNERRLKFHGVKESAR